MPSPVNERAEKAGAVHEAIARITSSAHRRLVAAGRAARTVTVKVRSADFATVSRSETSPVASADLDALTAVAQRLARAAVPEGGVRLLGVSLGGLVAAEACRMDKRLRACLIQDVFVPGDVLAAGVDQPTMWLTRDAQSMRDEGWPEWEVVLHQNSMLEAFEAAGAPGYLVHIPGMFHLNYTDFPLTVAAPVARAIGLIGAIDWQRGHQIINAYTLAFFDRHLRDRRPELLNPGNTDFPEVILRADRKTTARPASR